MSDSNLLDPIEAVLCCVGPQNIFDRYKLPLEEVKQKLVNYGIKNPDVALEEAEKNGLVELDSITTFGYCGVFGNKNIVIPTQKGMEAYEDLTIRKLLGIQI